MAGEASGKTPEELLDEIKTVMKTEMGYPADEVDAIGMDDSVKTATYEDSLDLIEFIMALEEKFGIHIPDEDAERFDSFTFRDLVSYIAEHTSRS